MRTQVSGVAVMVSVLMLSTGCADRTPRSEPIPLMGEVPDTRIAVHLPEETGKAHRDVMMQHLETVQVLVGALAAEDYTLAKGVAETHIGFFARRHTATRYAPPEYVELAMAHVRATRDLSAAIPSKDMKQILPRLNGMLGTCMACHLKYRVGSPARS